MRHPSFLGRRRQQLVLHRLLWRSISRALCEIPKGKYLMVQEWPLENALWDETRYRQVSKRLGLLRGVLVKRCCADGISKVWELASNEQVFLDTVLELVPTCRCDGFPRKAASVEAGFYSQEVVALFWSFIAQTLSKLNPFQDVSGVNSTDCAIPCGGVKNNTPV